MITRTDTTEYEWASNDPAFLSEYSLSIIWGGDDEDEAWADL